MSRPTDTAATTPALSAQDVTAYLRRHPDFLLRHPSLASVLAPPARAHGDRVFDLQTFFIARLKDDIAALRAREDRLLAAVRSERARQARTQEAVIAMLGATSFAHLIEIVRDDFLHLLDLDVVALAVENGGDARTDAALGVVCLGPGTIDDVLAGESGVVVREGEGDARLFGGAAGLVASSALVPLDLGPRAPRCLLALGARDHARFSGACGAFAFLGRALERCLASWLDLAP